MYSAVLIHTGPHQYEGGSLSEVPTSQSLAGLQLLSDPSTSNPPPPLLSINTPVRNLLITPHTQSTDAISVGPSSPPVPKKLAEQIWKGEYIDLKELLPSHLGAPEPTVFDLLGKSEKVRPKKNISNIQEWSICFNTFMAIVAMRQPERINDLLAYSSMIIKASLDYDDTPWLSYDSHFRRQVAAVPQARWSQLDAPLWTMYFTRAKPKYIPIEAQTDAAMSRKAIKGGERARSFPYAPMPICRKWNSVEGCNLPMCRYRHCCYKCNAKSHKAIHCQNQRDHLNDKAPPFRLDPGSRS